MVLFRRTRIEESFQGGQQHQDGFQTLFAGHAHHPNYHHPDWQGSCPP